MQKTRTPCGQVTGENGGVRRQDVVFWKSTPRQDPHMFLGLRTVAFHVPADRLEEAKEWYTRAAGIEPYFDQPFYVGYNVGGFELGLQPSGQQGPGGTVVYWGTRDISSEVNRLVDIAATIVEPIQDVGEGIRVCTLADPFGNLFGVIENPHFDPKAVT